MVDKSKPGAAVHNVTIVYSISTWENMSTVMFEYPRLNVVVFYFLLRMFSVCNRKNVYF